MVRVYFDQMLLDTFPKTRRRARKRSTKCMTRREERLAKESRAKAGRVRNRIAELDALIERSERRHYLPDCTFEYPDYDNGRTLIYMRRSGKKFLIGKREWKSN